MFPAIQRCISFLVFILSFFPAVSLAQRHTEKGDKKELDSVYASIYKLISDAKYIEAHNETVKSIYVYRSDTAFVSALYMLLSDVERLTGNKDASMAYLRKSEAILRSLGEATARRKQHLVYQRIANLYYEMENYDSAYAYAQASLISCREYRPEHMELMQVQNLPIIGYHYFREGNYRLAEQNYDEVLEINRRKNAECNNPIIYIKLADIRVAQHNYSAAIALAETGLAIADSCHDTQYQLAMVNKLIGISRMAGNSEKTAKYLQMKIDLGNTIHLTEQQDQLQELETKFDTRLKEEENNSLKATNKRQEAQSRFQVIVILLSIVVLAVVLVFAASFFSQKHRIAKQKEAVDRLNLLNQKIFSVIAHDFKGPMLGIEMLLGMHEKYGMTPETFVQQTNQLRNDIKQANLIMENLLSWSKTELGISGFSQQASEPLAVSDEVTAQLGSLLSRKNLSVKNTISPGSALSVPPDILKIIFRNLLSNAIKFSHEGAEIRLEHDRETDRFSVRDSGVGMDEDRVRRLFQGRSDSRLGTHRETGFGIGLNIVYELIRKYNGKIWVESRVGEGTAVHFKF